MATKSPGIYFTEVDNTKYSNSTTTTGTIVAIIGFATMGPVDTPTEITSARNFRKTFGDPITGQYAGLAALNVLNSNGIVLFTRIADSKASTSKYIVKNGTSAVYGSTYFNAASDILVGTTGFYNKKIYACKVTDSDNKKTKTIFVRSPYSSKSKLALSNIYSQMSSQLSATEGEYEFAAGNNKAGFYSYKVQTTTDGGTNWTSLTDNDLFLTIGSDALSASTLETNMENSLTAGSPAQYEVYVQGGSTLTTVAATDAAPVSLNTAYTFGLSIDNTYTKQIVTFTSTSTSVTYAQVATQLTSALSAVGVYCFFKAGTGSGASKLVFVKKGSVVKITSTTYTDNAQPSSTDLFVYNDSADTTFIATDGTGINHELQTDTSGQTTTYSVFDTEHGGTAFTGLRVYNVGSINASASILDGEDFTISYNSYTDSIVLKTVATGSTTGIKIVDGTLGSGLVTSSGVDIIGTRLGQTAITSVISRDSSKRITFTSASDVAYPVVATYDTTTYTSSYYADLVSLLNNVTNNTGSYAVPDSTKDIIVFEAKEVGSATAGITVDVYTETNSTDNTTAHYIDVYVDGIKKETFEDVSYSYSSTTNFVNTINADSDSGGSSYIQVTVVKNSEDDAIGLSDGTYTIGKLNNTGDIAYDSTTMDETSYTSYDYAVGDNGIVDDPSDLIDNLIGDTDESELANMDLYNYSVLITPDCIDSNIQDEAIKLCEERGDAIYIADPPQGLNKASVIKWHNGIGGYGRSNSLTSQYAAVYWPWVKVYNSYDELYEWVMPSVVMAAKYCAVDNDYGSWYAPAGETNGVLSVYDIEQYPKKSDRDDLYTGTNRVNPIIKYNNGSFLAFGEKTLYRSNSTLTKIHTRRMLLEIKKNLKSSLRGMLFLPSISSNLSKISSYATSIMETYKTGGGVTSYSVVCDSSNNSTETLQQDIVYLDVAMVPVGSMEEIKVTLTLNKSDSSTTETSTAS